MPFADILDSVGSKGTLKKKEKNYKLKGNQYLEICGFLKPNNDFLALLTKIII